jgi:hypothetical protein
VEQLKMNSFAQLDEQGAINFLQLVLESHPQRVKSITPREKCIVKAILSDRTYQQVGSTEAYSEGSLQNAASKLFRDLNYVLCTEVDRKNFKATISAAMAKGTRREVASGVTTNLWILEGRSQVVTINNKFGSSQEFSVLNLVNSYSPLFASTFCYQSWKDDPLTELAINLVGNAGPDYAKQILAGEPQAIKQFIELLQKNPSLVIVEYELTPSSDSYEPRSGCIDLLWTLATKAHNSCFVLVNAPAPIVNRMNNRLQSTRTSPDSHQLPRFLSVSGYENRCLEIVNQYLNRNCSVPDKKLELIGRTRFDGSYQSAS